MAFVNYDTPEMTDYERWMARQGPKEVEWANGGLPAPKPDKTY